MKRYYYYLYMRPLFCFFCMDWKQHIWAYGEYHCQHEAEHGETSTLIEELIRIENDTRPMLRK